MNNSSSMSEQIIVLQIWGRIVPRNIRKHIFYGNILYNVRIDGSSAPIWEHFDRGRQKL